jgi:hypothetical protein
MVVILYYLGERMYMFNTGAIIFQIFKKFLNVRMWIGLQKGECAHFSEWSMRQTERKTGETVTSQRSQ